MARIYRICSRCVMDTSDPKIEFDRNGVCNHCRTYYRIQAYASKSKDAAQKLNEIVNKIKRQGLNKEYDCVAGVSGGIDSTYNIYVAKKLGLRPLAVHLDNGWNSELAVCNIERTLNNLDVDLYTYVIDWEEFRDLQLSYLKSGVINIEALTDHAISAILYSIADQRGIKYILLGTNLVTESILPKSWGYSYTDLVNIRDIHHRYGTVKLETYPTLSSARSFYYKYLKGIKIVSLLNYVSYAKKDVKPFLIQELDWKDYSGKHGESTFTYFYQSYILPRRLNVDKRRAHLSCLICSGELTREQALEELQVPLYTEEEVGREKEYAIKKLDITEEEFENYMKLPVRSYRDFKTDITVSIYHTLTGVPKLLWITLFILGHIRKAIDIILKSMRITNKKPKHAHTSKGEAYVEP